MLNKELARMSKLVYTHRESAQELLYFVEYLMVSSNPLDREDAKEYFAKIRKGEALV